MIVVLSFGLRSLLCASLIVFRLIFFFFFNDPATTEIYTLSLHDALPIFGGESVLIRRRRFVPLVTLDRIIPIDPIDRKSTRLNSSHANISYAVFCLKKKTDREDTPPADGPAEVRRERPADHRRQQQKPQR